MIYSSDFEFETNGNVENSLDWNYASGSNLDIEFLKSSGTTFAGYQSFPTTPHQSVEAKFHFKTTGATVKTGVFVRYVNSSNYVLLAVDHTTRQSTLVERIDGSDNVLATDPLAAEADSGGCAVKLEVIGRRVRYWFQPQRRPVEDVPPLGAADLNGNYNDVGIWGLYSTASAANDAEIQFFTARDLPSNCLPAPTFTVQSAPAMKLTPYTLTAGDLAPKVMLLHWEVCPLDDDDFCEVFTQTTIAGIATITVYVRPGFRYTARVRDEKTNGLLGEWVEFEFVATGSKSVVSTPTLPDEQFPDVRPDYAMPRQNSAITNATVASSGRETVRSGDVDVRSSWTLGFRNRPKEEIKQLENFFKRMRASAGIFKWIHPSNGKTYIARMGADEFSISVKDRNTQGKPIGDCEVQIMEARMGDAASLDLEFAGDDNLP